MALIICTECGREISDKASICPHCGNPMSNNTIASDTPKHSALSNQKIFKVVLPIILILLVVVSATVVHLNNVKKGELEARNTYIDDLNALLNAVIYAGGTAETLCNSTKNVWYNTIFEKSDEATDKYTKTSYGSFHSDFNTSISYLYSDSTFSNKISSLENYKDSLAAFYKKLNNPPDDFEDCYSSATQLYTDCLSLIDLAINPTGSLQNYSDNFSKYDSAIVSSIQKLKAQIPEKD